MRETESRGRRLDNGEWVYGDLCCHYENQRRFIACDQMFYTHAECGIERLVSERFHEVDPETVGQCTGLEDKNGRKIYRDDIFIHPDVPKYRYQVYRDDATASYPWFNGDGCGFDPKEIEVIGNIHDNPELLKGG